jgi:predicted NAD/FAD-binding protein
VKVAIVGSGIAGMASAWLLSRAHEVTLFEANERIGGHTHTHEVELDGVPYAIDTGFIVFNTANYPRLTALFDELGVTSQPTTMSFAVRNDASGLEYNATDLDRLFVQRRNLVSPRFWGMVRDILRFYRQAPALVDGGDASITLGDWLDRERYGAAFRDDHLVPMAGALWSSPPGDVLAIPLRHLVAFMANHHMLQTDDRPQWRVVSGGSASYVRALRRRWRVHERVGCAVRAVRRHDDGVTVTSTAGDERYDRVVLACHSDEALALLADADAREREILGAIGFRHNDVVLHTDARLLPRRRRAWAAWNAFVPAQRDEHCTVSYCMNLLQGIASPRPFVVTLNRTAAIDPALVLARMRYAHPVFNAAAVAAQARRHEIQGVRRTWFAGAYWGWGFHEDGMRSAHAVAEDFAIG